MTGRRRRSDRSGRAPLFSPGRPVVAGRDQQRRFLGPQHPHSPYLPQSQPSWYVAGCRNEIVPKGRRHATSDVSAISEAAIRPVSLICGAGGDRTSSSAGLLHAGGCAPARTNSFNDFAGVAAQRCNPKRRLGVSRDDSAMACRSICSPPKAGEACAQRGIANLCGGTIGRVRHRSEWGSCSRPGCALERPPAWTTAVSTVGKRLEPGADCSPLAGRLPGR